MVPRDPAADAPRRRHGPRRRRPLIAAPTVPTAPGLPRRRACLPRPRPPRPRRRSRSHPTPTSRSGSGSCRTTTRDSCWSRRPTRRTLPFRLKLNHVSQFKYTNTHGGAPTYVTHLGEVKDVNKRNDFQLTRDVFYFSGYVFDHNARLQHPPLHLDGRPDGDGGRICRLRVQQGVRAAGRILLAAELARHDRHLSVLPGHRPQHGGQLHAARIHPGRLGQRRAVPWLQLHRDGRQLAQHARHRGHEDRLPLRLRRLVLVRPQRLRQGLERLRAPRGAGAAHRHRLHVRARRSPLRSLGLQPGEQRHLYLGRHVAVRDRHAGARRHRLAGQLLPVGRRCRDQVPRASPSTPSSPIAG